MRTFVKKYTMAYFHVYTKGLEDRQIFKERKDYICGMNILAVTVFSCDIRLLAFVLMSNHFHFVLDTTRENAEYFIRMFKLSLSRYFQLEYGELKMLNRLATTVSMLDDSDEGLKRLIAYVLNNPVKAGINCVPQGYEWSSADCYFNQTDYKRDTTKISDYSVKALRKILRSKKRLPGHWRLNSSQYVIPQSYVDHLAVERCYVGSRSFEFYLSRSLAVRKSANDNVSFSDSLVQSALSELLEKKYDVSDLSELDGFMKNLLVRDLKGRLGASPKQIARLMRMSIADVLQALS